MAQKYSHSVIIRLSAIAVSSIGTFLLLPIILRTLGEYNFGIWGMVSALTGYLLLLDFGIALACTRYLSIHSANQAQWQKIVSNALLLSGVIAACLLIVALSLVICLYTGLFSDANHLVITIITIVILEVAISIPLRIYMSILRAEVRYFDIGVFELIRVTLRISGIALALYLQYGLIEIVVISSLVNILFFFLPLISTFYRHKQIFFSLNNKSKKTFFELLNFSKFTAISQIAEFLKFRTDSVLVALIIGINASAHYTIIVFIVMMLTQVLMRFVSYWDTVIISYVGSNDSENAIRSLFKSLDIGISLSIFSLLNIIIFGKTLIALWVGEQYSFLYEPLVLLTLVLISISFQMATTPYFNAIGQEKANAGVDLAEILVKLVLLVPLASAFSLNGFIYATLIASYLIGIGARLWMLSAFTTIKYIDIAGAVSKLFIKPIIYSVIIFITYEFFTKALPNKYLVLALITFLQTFTLFTLFKFYKKQLVT